MRLPISTQLREIGFVVFPANVASMHILNEKQPLLLGKGLGVQRAIRMFAGLGPSETERTSVARVTNHFEYGIVLQGHPMQFSCMRTTTNAAWEEESLGAKILDGGPGGPCSFEGGKQQTEGLLDLGIGIKDDRLVLCVEQTDRQRDFQGRTTGFVENPSLQAGLQDMELGLRHGALYYVSSGSSSRKTSSESSTEDT